MAVRVCLLLALLGGASLLQQRSWRSDEALWREAVILNSTSPRPAYNLGLALRQQGRFAESIPWFVQAADRAQGHPEEAVYRDRIRVQFMAMESLGMVVCDSAWLQPYC